MDNYDFLLKFLVIGEAGTGKSCILTRFLEGKCNKDIITICTITHVCVDKASQTHTIGVEFGSKIVTVGKHNVKLQIWDTAGQERFRSVTKSYYRGAAGALLVFDITNRKSFDSVGLWMNDARKLANPNIVIILVGNKTDLETQRKVSFMEASRLANEYEVMYVETSALTGDGIEDIFLNVTRSILTKIETGLIDPEGMGSGIQFDSRRQDESSGNGSVAKRNCC